MKACGQWSLGFLFGLYAFHGHFFVQAGSGLDEFFQRRLPQVFKRTQFHVAETLARSLEQKLRIRQGGAAQKAESQVIACNREIAHGPVRFKGRDFPGIHGLSCARNRFTDQLTQSLRHSLQVSSLYST